MARVAGPPQGHAAHDAQRQHRHRGEHHGVHADAPVQRQHRRAGDHVGGGAVAVQGDGERQQGGADRDLHRIAIDLAQNHPDQRVEQAGVDHQAEEQDREQQQGGRRRDHLQAVENHLAGGVAETAGNGKHDGNEGKCHDGRHALGHDHVGEHDHHRQPE